MKPFHRSCEAVLKHGLGIDSDDPIVGFDHVGIHPESDLSSVLQQAFGRRRKVSAPLDLAARAFSTRSRPTPTEATPMLAEKFLLLLETLKSRSYPDGG